MRKMIRVIVAILMGLWALQEADLHAAETNPLEVLAFNYPPGMGKSSLSNEGFSVELVRAAFASQGISIKMKYVPVKRAITEISKNNYLAYIGVRNTFDEEVRSHIHEYPLFVVRLMVFYRKDRYPKGFGFSKLSDLKDYRIGVLGGGITDLIGKANGLKTEPSNSLINVFRKLDKGRSDIGIAWEFSIKLLFNDLFGDKADEYVIYQDMPFHTVNNTLLLNDRHSEFAYFESKIKAGMKAIGTNGRWKEILERYYGSGNIPEISIKMFESTIAGY